MEVLPRESRQSKQSHSPQWLSLCFTHRKVIYTKYWACVECPFENICYHYENALICLNVLTKLGSLDRCTSKHGAANPDFLLWFIVYVHHIAEWICTRSQHHMNTGPICLYTSSTFEWQCLNKILWAKVLGIPSTSLSVTESAGR